MGKKEEFIKRIFGSKYNSESSLKRGSRFDSLIELLIDKGRATIPLSKTTVEILDNATEPMKISETLSRRLSQSMSKAEKDRQYLKEMRYLTSRGLLGDYIALVRERQGISMRDVALKLNISEDFLKHIERGKTEFIINIGAEKLIELAKVLKISIPDFVDIVGKTCQSLARRRLFSLAFASSQEEKSQSVEVSINKFLADFKQKAQVLIDRYKK